jgi:hypothetical protein
VRMMNDPRQHAPATLRNRDFILGILRDVLPTKGVILEIASGSGEHVVHFARNLPNLVFQPSDREPDALQSVAAWVKARVTNVCAPVVLDASQSPWPIASADGIICINLVHISPWDATLAFIRGAAAILPPTAALWSIQTRRIRNDSEQPSVRPKPSRSEPGLGSARPRSGRSNRAIRWILGSDNRRDARKQPKRGVPPDLIEMVRSRAAGELPPRATRILGHPRSDRSVPHDSRRRLVQSRPRCS